MALSSASVDRFPNEPGQPQTDTYSTRLDPGTKAKVQASADTQYATTDLRRAHTVAHGRNTKETATIGSRTTRERLATSLLRVKDSHEILRKRSFKRPDTSQAPRDAAVGAREPNHFTVGNVGQNGKIFLRPIRNPPTKEPFPAPSIPSPSQSRQEHFAHGRGGPESDEPSRWSNSQLSELRPDLIPEESCEDGDSVNTESAHSQYHGLPHHRPRKAHSFSTISEQRSESRAGRAGELRIYIDRADNRPKTANEPSQRALEDAIPRYRLDLPRSNLDNETALHSSIYSRTSLSDIMRTSRLPREYWIGTLASDTYLRNPERPSFVGSVFSGAGAIELPQSSAVSENPVFYELKEPIEPAIFETLVSEMDKESVVRYASGTKDISAATPARIVAQISSASFMDYELVSDFFLTFRSYISTSTLLALLLARLRWAINRLQDDGRIIRIRTFAALRHWILNYFVDDFVPEYDLRGHFCETINSMYDDVKSRQGGGMSDLKILIDLKRCWYGKSSLYWDFPNDHDVFQSPDVAILPGDREADTLETAVGGDLLALVRTKSGMEAGPAGTLYRPNHHSRNNSSNTVKSVPISAGSDRSFQAISCSLPPKSPKRLSLSLANKAPHPVPLPLKPTSSREAYPPSPLTSRRYPYHGHSHKRSGSFSDSVRDDRAPFSLVNLDQQGVIAGREALDLSSLIRGELYPPAESYTIMMAPPSPPLPSSAKNLASDRRSTTHGIHKPAASTSGVKTIIGSIRRALNSRHGASGSLSRAMNGAANASLPGRTSALPTNVAFGSDAYRGRKTAAGVKKPTRIDTLCDEVLKQYRAAISEQTDTTGGSRSADSQNHADLRSSAPGIPRATSQVTAGSESIVIVDGTGLGLPVMSGAIGEPNAGLQQPPGFLESEPSPATVRAPSPYGPHQRSTLATDEYSLPIFYDESHPGPSSRASKFLRPSGFSESSRRSYSVERASISWKRTSSSLRLRKYASFQSGVSKHRLTMGSDSIPPLPSGSSQQHSDKPSGPTLRRRPGGDLRQMRNGGGFQSRPDSGSFVSDITYRSSGADTAVTRVEEPYSRPQTSLIPPNPRFSLLTTHSSQNLRRSFEDAIAQFAQIPDDDDGGVESTLLKLEGKWHGASVEDAEAAAAGTDQHLQHYDPGEVSGEEWLRQGRGSAGHHNFANSDALARRRQTFFGDGLTYSQVQGRIVPQRPYSDSIAESEDSYSSIPLLERGLSDESMKKPVASRPTSHMAGPSRFQPSFSSRETSDMESSHPSIDIVKETESMKRIPRGSTLPGNPSGSRKPTGRLSGLSSGISIDMIDSKEAAEQRFSIDTQSMTDSSLGIPPHPLAHPPSPPMTVQNTRSVGSWTTPLNPVLFQAQPLTPDPSPRNKMAQQANTRPINTQQVSGDVLSQSEKGRRFPEPLKIAGPEHVPFVLSCESHVLAQQLTLVEMAALSEVDWRDLVDMRWSSGSPTMLSWVQFLMEEEHRGINLVVGRFNLMVRWVLSEIVLTQDIHERARTIAKFIHTAAHARRMCNYATMLQIAIALSSTDCSRLQATWDLVPVADKRLLKDMESLTQPIRNFHELRLEMEMANAQDGCIPFVGLYVHDLTYNAQKPARVTTQDGESLINFERYRTTAKIVKSLLRLIDASTRYRFEPVPGIIERCLWIASLSEEQVQLRSKQLE
ncbi:guanine nucleotide exchange factor LTE1 [Aspergillus awamori]|uniref:Guanine nucleotide exchange factor LTE1 n=1 Tax=Aspergillus awamori TaxID=105351 RepID=A0A401KGK2_ASPAW|nr:guanine nucleotide exchange factor LTE1 [Aspergillus awamori]